MLLVFEYYLSKFGGFCVMKRKQSYFTMMVLQQ